MCSAFLKTCFPAFYFSHSILQNCITERKRLPSGMQCSVNGTENVGTGGSHVPFCKTAKAAIRDVLQLPPASLGMFYALSIPEAFFKGCYLFCYNSLKQYTCMKLFINEKLSACRGRVSSGWWEQSEIVHLHARSQFHWLFYCPFLYSGKSRRFVNLCVWTSWMPYGCCFKNICRDFK